MVHVQSHQRRERDALSGTNQEQRQREPGRRTGEGQRCDHDQTEHFQDHAKRGCARAQPPSDMWATQWTKKEANAERQDRQASYQRIVT